VDAWYRISNEADVASPALLVYPDRIDENLRRMTAIAGGPERLRPHVKTHKMPEVIALARGRGITKFKAATIAEAEMTAAAAAVSACGGSPAAAVFACGGSPAAAVFACGGSPAAAVSHASDVLLAYPVVGPAAARLVALGPRFPHTRFRAVVDSDEGLDDLERAATAADALIDVLLDLDVGMHRTGVPPGPEAVRLARRIAAAPQLTFGGLHAYDGHLHDTDHARLVTRVAEAFAPVWRLRDELAAAGLPVPRVVAGGTPTLPILARHADVELGAGTTVLWDSGQPVISPDLDFLNAAVLLARVVSRPVAGRLCLDLGHKAVASEMPHPRLRILGLDDAEFVMHSEEHLVVETPRAAEFPVGTVIYAVPRHICPTVALHERAWVVRDGRADTEWDVAARRRRLTV